MRARRATHTIKGMEEKLFLKESPSQTPRLVKLTGLLAEWEADAEAAHLARVTGAAPGPITGLPTWTANSAAACTPA